MEWVQLNNGEMVSFANAQDKPSFPSPLNALSEPAGLIQIGGSLSPDWLLYAYRRGIFPWYSSEDPILWWSPDPRTILYPQSFKKSRSLAKVMRNAGFTVTFDTAFDQVIDLCAATRDETWILPEMIDAYHQLYQLGYAHSVEVWRNNCLVGGLYGLALGKMFFGESMFSKESNASKVALASLCEQLLAWDYLAIDCQFSTEHLCSLGAEPVSREAFLGLLKKSLLGSTDLGSWAYLNTK